MVDNDEEIDRQYINAADRRYARKTIKGTDEADAFADFDLQKTGGLIPKTMTFAQFQKLKMKTCAACGVKAVFVAHELPVGPRGFCTEEHFALYAGLPVKPKGYYGYEKIGEENGNNNGRKDV